VQRLAPLAVGFLMTASAIGSRQEGLRLDEIMAFNGRVARRRDFAAPEAEIIGRADFGVVGLAVGGRSSCARDVTSETLHAQTIAAVVTSLHLVANMGTQPPFVQWIWALV
jgi:hypothetical protein